MKTRGKRKLAQVDCLHKIQHINYIFSSSFMSESHIFSHLENSKKKCNKLRSQSKANTKRWCTFGTLVMLSIPQSQTQWCSLWHLSSEKAKRRKIKSFSSPTIQLSIPMIRSRIVREATYRDTANYQLSPVIRFIFTVAHSCPFSLSRHFECFKWQQEL